MSTPQSPFMDHASPVLNGDPNLTDEKRASLWDIFHGSKDPNELAQKLQSIDASNETKHSLFMAKQASSPAPAPLDKVTDAVQKMANLDPKMMDLVEAHPNLLKAFTTAATTAEKPAGESASTSSTAPKDKTASTAPKAPKAPLAPRADGQPHFPPIPEGHHRILATNGGVYDVPAENIDAVRAKDPNLHILNP